MTAPARATGLVVPLQPLFDAMTDGVLMLDEMGRRTYANRALNELVGTDARRPIANSEPPPWIPEAQHDRYREYVEAVRDGRLAPDVVSIDWSIVDAFGREVPAIFKILPMTNGRGRNGALWLIIPDDDAVADGRRQRRLEEALRRIGAEVARVGFAPGMLAPAPAVPSAPELDRLSKREREVVQLLLEGHRVVSIARELCVSEHTVRNHLKSIFRKTDVHSQAELVELMRGNGRHA